MFKNVVVLFIVSIIIAMFVATPVHRPVEKVHVDRPLAKVESTEERLERLLVQHPVTEVRALAGAIRNGDVMLNDRIASQNAVEFWSVNASVVPGAKIDAQNNVQILSIAWAKLVPGVESDAWWTLVLYHEYIHFVQYRDGTQSPETFQMVNLEQHPERVESQCTLKWYAEEEAYHKECELAVKLGSEDELNGLCRNVDDPEKFRTDLAQALTMSGSTPCRTVFEDHARSL